MDVAEAADKAPTPVQRAGEGDSDETLLRRFRGGAADAATLLYFRYADRLHALAAMKISPQLAVRVNADDIVQSVFRTFFRRAALGKFEVPEGEDLWKLFLVIALNKIRSAGTYHRAARRDVARTLQEPPAGTSAHVASGADENALTVLRLVIEEILAGLPESARAIVERRIEGYEVAEIAEAVGRSKRSVERVLREFRERLEGAITGRA